MGKKHKSTTNVEVAASAPALKLSPQEKDMVENILIKGGVNRRQAMKYLMAMGLSVITASGLVTNLSEAVAATPKRCGRIRVGGHSTSAKDTLEPGKFTLSTDYLRGHTFYNGLTRLDNKAQAHPELAKSFEPNSDASEWVFKLRNGVTFHNGKTLDADDVVYSIMRHKDPKVGSAAKAFADMVDEVKPDGKDTVIFQLNGSNADFPILMGTFNFMIIQNGTTDFRTANGTGPYKVKEFKPGIRSIGVRNESYFKEGRPYADELEFFGIPDSTARLNALLSGDVHMITEISSNSVNVVEDRKGVEVFSTPCPRICQLIMMVDRAPTNNLDLRLTIKNLLDRKKIFRTIAKGYGQIGNDHVFAPDSPLYNKELPQRNLDHDKAKYHFKRSGIENNKLELHVSPASMLSVEMGMLLQREAAKIGLTIDLKREPADGYWGNIWRKRSFHGGVWNPRPTYDLLLTVAWKSEAKWNETQFKSTRLDSLIDEGRATVDLAKRKEIYGEIQRILYQEGGNAIPLFLNYIDAISTNVKGLVPKPTGNLGGFNFADSVWLDT